MKKLFGFFAGLAAVCVPGVLAAQRAAADVGAPDGYRQIFAIEITEFTDGGHVTASEELAARMVGFGGRCCTESFKGAVVPCAYDCQLTDDAGTRLSARYILRGVDSAGDSCSVFIENNAVADSPWSKPRVVTDSKALGYLNQADLVGRLDNNGPFTIRIYARGYVRAEADTVMIPGDHGLLRAIVERPALKPGERCPAVIICHGFGGNCEDGFIGDLGRRLPAQGIATIRFDFNGHGRSEGRFSDMTVPNEIEDAKSVYRYLSSLPYVDTDRIGILGHSQGGVVAAMTAGQLGHERIKAAVLMCPAAALRDDCIRGNTFGKTYNPLDPPEYVDLGGGRQLGREFITTAFTLPIYETAARYHGAGCIIHGTGDRIVPYTYGERFHQLWPGSRWHLMPGYDHGFGPNPQAAVDLATAFLTSTL